jgi:hypothetical protein
MKQIFALGACVNRAVVAFVKKQAEGNYML